METLGQEREDLAKWTSQSTAKNVFFLSTGKSPHFEGNKS